MKIELLVTVHNPSGEYADPEKFREEVEHHVARLFAGFQVHYVRSTTDRMNPGQVIVQVVDE
jgi:hypothetical protein